MIGILDFETDPFEHGNIPAPFYGEILMENGNRWGYWGDDAARTTADKLKDMPKCTIYAHNGGKFDFHFLLPFVDPNTDVMLINGRIAKIKFGRVTLVDSYLLLPIPLAAYQKDEFDYRKLRRKVRERHKEEIVKYCAADCRYLLELIQGAHKRVGAHLTIGGAAVKSAENLKIRISRQNSDHDDAFRPYYYGGRVEALRTGIFTPRRPAYYLDINSAYPEAMRSPHPYGGQYDFSTELPARGKLGPQFATIVAVSRGALPIRDGAALHFPRDPIARTYYATGHEIAAGLDTGTLDIQEVQAVWTPRDYQDFGRYVDYHYAARMAAKKKGEKLIEIVEKLLLNSLYGKFATDPDTHKIYRFAEYGHDLAQDEGFEAWEEDTPIPQVGLSLWAAPSPRRAWSYYDVAVAASITGQVRAMLWRAMCAAGGVYYVDTDSLICDSPGDVKIGPELGRWKVESRPKTLYIAGKKIYAVRDNEGWKVATKGFRASPRKIRQLCQGKGITWKSPAPTFSVGSVASFLQREIKRAEKAVKLDKSGKRADNNDRYRRKPEEENP